MAVAEEHVNFVVNMFNRYDSKIKLTMEIEKEGTTPFLDVLVSRNTVIQLVGNENIVFRQNYKVFINTPFPTTVVILLLTDL